MPQPRSSSSRTTGGGARTSRAKSTSGGATKRASAGSAPAAKRSAAGSGAAKRTTSASAKRTASASAKRTTSASASKAGSASAKTGAARARAATDGGDVRVEAVAQRVRKLNERIIDAGREAGETTLSAYEKALKSIATSLDRGAGRSDVEWVSQLLSTQAKFIRDVTDSLTKAARDALK